MEIKFQKMHGTQNDFVVFHDMTNSVELGPEQVSKICDRRAGVGADGVIVVRPADSAQIRVLPAKELILSSTTCGSGVVPITSFPFRSTMYSAAARV